MTPFNKFLAEQKNTHMNHLEDMILLGGVSGARESINYLQALRNMLAGHTGNHIKTTLKWDGAPAIICGIDPTDGKFFVAKKSVFNKNPKVYKTPADVEADTSGDLATKLKLALLHFAKLGIEGVIQGDLLYTAADIKHETIDGEEYITFQPNTIVYAVPAKSTLAKTISASKIGVVWHTTYEGKTFESMSASFGKDISTKLNKLSSVWHQDATFKDVSGTATLTKDETAKLTNLLSQAGTVFRNIPPSTISDIANDEELRIRVMTYNNSKVRAGELITNPSAHTTGLMHYISDYYQKEMDAKKTEKGKAVWKAKQAEVLKYFARHSHKDITGIFVLMNLLTEAKDMIIKKMDSASSTRLFLRTKDGFRVTAPEGYVAIDHMGSAVKLVDRMGFSAANFSTDVIKGWER